MMLAISDRITISEDEELPWEELPLDSEFCFLDTLGNSYDGFRWVWVVVAWPTDE